MTSPFAQRLDPLRARMLATSFLLIGLCAGTGASADQQRNLELRWEAPQGCPQESEVRNRIHKILGSRRHDSLLRAEGAIRRMDGRYRLELDVQVGDVRGKRSLTSRSCENLAGAAAVEIGLLLHSVEDASKPKPTDNETTTLPLVDGSETSGSRSDGTDGQSSQAATEASPEKRTSDVAKSEVAKNEKEEQEEKQKEETEREVEEPPPNAETSSRWHVLLQAPTVALGVGPLPSPSLGLGLSLGLEYAHWQLQAQGLIWQRQNVPADGFPGFGADVDRMGGRLWACREIRFSWFGLAPCLAAAVERITVSATGSNILPIPRHILGASVGAGLQGRIHLASWIRLLASVSGEVELTRPEISIDRLGQLASPSTEEPPRDPPTPIHRFAPAALTATLSLEWAL